MSFGKITTIIKENTKEDLQTTKHSIVISYAANQAPYQKGW